MRITSYKLSIPLLALLALWVVRDLHGESESPWITHTIRAGETIYAISRTYSVPASDVLRFNEIDDPSAVPEGKEIVIPGVVSIARGDTLYGLSRRFDVSLTELLEANDLDEAATVRVGQKIRIPGSYAERSVAEGDRGIGEDSGRRDTTSTDLSANADEAPKWPHDGARRPRNGRVPGIAIKASTGDEIQSIASGRVSFVGPYAGFGTVVIVEAPTGYVYVYGGHGEVDVRPGDAVERGSVIGRVGGSGGETKVYFSVWRDDAPVDPESAPRS